MPELKALPPSTPGPLPPLSKAPASRASVLFPPATLPQAAHQGDALGPISHSSGSALTAISLETSQVQSGAALKPASAAEVGQAVQESINASYTQVPDRGGESRHGLNRRLQSHTMDQAASPARAVHYDGSEIVVIAFEGTGAFGARQAPIMQDAARRLAQKGLSTQGTGLSLQGAVMSGISAREGKTAPWSGLAAGPLDSLLQEPELQAHSQWLSFPSEEFEALGNPSAIQNTSLKQILKEAVGSSIGETPGINDALLAVREIQAQARAQGKDPQFVIVSHSSGGRSAVKFLEKARGIKGEDGQPLAFPFVMTIDPVREAHEAIGEAALELVNKGTEHNLNRVRGLLDALPLIEVKPKTVYPPLVRHTWQPESLYVPGNVGKFLSFYQLKDTEGLKMEPRFGIQGSPVKGAINREVRDVGTAGHGEIAYNPAVTKAFVEQLKGMLHSQTKN